MIPRAKSLKSRITILVLAALLVLQSVSYLFIRSSIATNVRASVRDELVLGKRVLQRLLDRNAASLGQGAEVLAADFGLRAAVSSQDAATLESALENHGSRIGADLISFFDRRRVMIAHVDSQGSGKAPAGLLSEDAASSGASSARVVSLEGRLVQLVTLPVRAPVLIGWVVVGFDVGDAIANEMKQLTALDVTFIVDDEASELAPGSISPTGRPTARVIYTTLDAAEGDAVRSQLVLLADSQSGSLEMDLNGTTYAASLASVSAASNGHVYALLHRSISAAAMAYDRLHLSLLIITLVGLVVSVIFSWMTAHRIAAPVKRLVDSTRQLGAGDFSGHIETSGVEELSKLAVAFNAMSDQITRRETRIRQLAYEDPLTGLANGAGVMDCLAQILGTGTTTTVAKAATGAVLIIDLRRFKHVNNVLGIRAGDRLLRGVADRISKKLAGGDLLIGRMHGDEFAIVAPGASCQDALELASRLNELLKEPLLLDGTAIDLSLAIGISQWPAHGNTPEGLLNKCEVAMYAAKRSQHPIQVYSESLDDVSESSLSLISELRQAIRASDLVLYFQPKVQLRSRMASGAEALVRWQHPQRGLIPPDRFIPFAESSGVIVEVTAWVMQSAIAQLARWNEAGRSMALSVNLSTRDLMNGQLPQQLETLLRGHSVRPSQLCLEITESAIMQDIDRALNTLNQLRALGVGLSIDDFGTGYSSLSYLKKMPVDELKIDRSFIMAMEADKSDEMIVRSTVELGHNLGLRVVAEGIETQGMLDILVGFGCDFAQGYFLGKPMPATTFCTWQDNWLASTSSRQQAKVTQ